MDLPSFKLSIVVTGDALDLDAVTRSLERPPTYGIRKGEQQGRARMLARTTVWAWARDPTHSWSLEDAAGPMLEDISRASAALLRLSMEGFNVFFQAVCVLPPPGESLPDLGLSVSTMARLVSMGAELDIDLYHASERSTQF